MTGQNSTLPADSAVDVEPGTNPAAPHPEIGSLRDIGTLQSIISKELGAAREAASVQLYKLLSGHQKSDLPLSERIATIRLLASEGLKQVALLARDKEAGLAAVAGLSDEQALADLCLFASAVSVRRAAAEKIQDQALAANLLEKLGDKDKTVTRILKSRQPGHPAGESPTAEGRGADPALQAELEAFLAPHLEFLDGLTAPVMPDTLERLRALAAALPESLTARIRTPDGSLTGAALRHGRLLTAAVALNTRQAEIEQVRNAVTAVSHKQARQLATTRNRLRRLIKEIGWPRGAPASPDIDSLLSLDQNLVTLERENLAYQQQLAASTAPLLDNLRKLLDEGNSNEASQTWDKLQGIISNLNGQFARQARDATTEFRTRINELRDWKNFAASEKKKELIGQMQHLLESRMNAPDRARQINRLHGEWKLLGRTSQNEQLWEEFKSLSDQAYAPCKEYFREQKQQMAVNLQRRNEICDQLEAYLKDLDRENIRIVDLKKIEKQAGDDWKRFAPVEQTKIKKLQKRYYGLLNEIRQLRRVSAKDNGRQKQALVEQARQLATLEDRQAAMQQAKSLQAKWKTIGPSTFKEDRRYWDEFRAACDALFERQNEQKREQRDEVESALASSQAVIQKLDTLLSAADEEFRESRKLFASLRSEFQNALNSRIKKERKQLLDQFNTVSRRIEARFNTLPDRKTQEALTLLKNKAAVCLELETRLLHNVGSNNPVEPVDDAIQSRWSAAPDCGKPEFDRLMAARFEALTGCRTQAEFDKLLQTAENDARQQVIELEIKAGLDSPQADRQQRMEIQLRQLQDNFGRQGAMQTDEKLQLAKGFDLHFLCFGPLSEPLRADLQKRSDRAVSRLASLT